MSKNKPVFLFDVDKTLTNSKKQITPYTISVLEKIQKKYTVGLATGRSYATLKNYILPHFDKNTIHIVSGGGQIIRNNGEVLWQKNIDNDVLEEIRKKLPNENDGLLFCKGDYIYIAKNLWEDTRENPWEFKIKAFDTKEFKDLPLITIYKIEENFVYFLKSKKDVECKFMQSYADKLFVDITAKGVSKASCLEKWAELNKVNWENVIFFGDSENDVELVEKAGIGIAVGNAVNQVKGKADEIIDSVDDDGVAKYLERFL